MKSTTEITHNGSLAIGTPYSFTVTGANIVIQAAGVAGNSPAGTMGGTKTGSGWNLATSLTIPLPVQLVTFTGQPASSNTVKLDWTTISETNNYGFRVQRRGAADQNFVDLANAFIPGHGTTTAAQHYTFTDAAATAGTWSYRLNQIDLDGSSHPSEPIQVSVVTGIVDNAPRTFSLRFGRIY